MPFAEIDARRRGREAGDAETLEDWRGASARFYDGCRDEVALLLGEPGWRLTDEEPMVVTWFSRVE